MFVFNGKTLPYRAMLKDGERIVETFANSLPSGSFACMREQGGGVDAKVFMRWAQLFASHVSHLTQNNRRVLLIMDAYRSHMTLRLLGFLNERSIIVYALPAHTSGKTQPLDVTVFSPFKAFLNEAVNMAVAGGNPSWDGFAFCKILRYAYEKAFTISTIKAGFRRAGLWPFDPSRLLSVPRPPSLNDTYSLMPVNELEGLLEKKRKELRDTVLGEELVMSAAGYIDSTYGAVLTSENALELARKKDILDREKRDSVAVRAASTAQRAAMRDAVHRREVAAFRQERAEKRAALAGMTVEAFKASVWPLAERRARARWAVALRRHGVGWSGSW